VAPDTVTEQDPPTLRLQLVDEKVTVPVPLWLQLIVSPVTGTVNPATVAVQVVAVQVTVVVVVALFTVRPEVPWLPWLLMSPP
jgi:hypothetical protein